MTPEESWSALVHSLTVEQFQRPVAREWIGATGDVAQIHEEARRIRELLREPPQVCERRRAYLEAGIVADKKRRAA